MKALKKKYDNKDSMPKMEDDYRLPRITIPHEGNIETQSHQVGKSYVMKIKAKKTSHDEHGSSYKITHLEAPKEKRYLLNASTDNTDNTLT